MNEKTHSKQLYSTIYIVTSIKKPFLITHYLLPLSSFY